MAEEFLDFTNVNVIFKEMCCKGMAKRVACYVFVDLCFLGCIDYYLLEVS